VACPSLLAWSSDNATPELYVLDTPPQRESTTSPSVWSMHCAPCASPAMTGAGASCKGGRAREVGTLKTKQVLQSEQVP
jgi:hypothetical protein